MPHPSTLTSLRQLLCALAITAAGPALAAGAVTGVTATPAKGLSATNFTLTIQGTGQCSVAVSTAKDGADGWSKTLSENLPLGTFPRDWSFTPPALLGSKATKGNLPTGKYTVWAHTHATNGCTAAAEHLATFEVAAPIHLAPLPKCPEGWTLQNSTSAGGYTCKPKSPAPAPCPPKHEWFNDGCTAGCRQLVY